MDNIKNDFYYVKRLLKRIEVTMRYLEGVTIDDLASDGFMCDAIENRFTKISEDASKLTKDYKESINAIPWPAIYSIRNRVVHDYDVVDFSILYKTVKTNFPQFKRALLDSIPTCHMKLNDEPFQLIKSKQKTIEMRLFDEKRQKLKIGDLIVFTNNKTKEEMLTEVVDLKRYNDFHELYAHYMKTEIGYGKDDNPNPNDMNEYYKDNDIKKYGVLAIEIKVY